MGGTSSNEDSYMVWEILAELFQFQRQVGIISRINDAQRDHFRPTLKSRISNLFCWKIWA